MRPYGVAILMFFINYYPYLLALIFAAALMTTPIPAKGQFITRALTALVIAIFLAHFNRIFEVWPTYRAFPSGHTSFCAGLAWSLAMLRPWTLFFTIPSLIAMGAGLVLTHCHTSLDVFGAFPLVVVVYGVIHAWWRIPSDMAPLDRATVST